MSAARKIQPFDFSHLPKVNSQELALRQSLVEAYPQLAQQDENFFSDFFRRFGEGLPVEMRGKFVAMEEQNLHDFAKALAKNCLVFKFKAEPQAQNLWLEIDPGLAQALTHQVLGGIGEAKTEESGASLTWPLSEISQGTLEFLVTKALQAFDSFGSGNSLLGPKQLSFQEICESANSINTTASNERGLSFKFFLILVAEGGVLVKGYVTLHLPHPWLTGVLLRQDIISELAARQEVEVNDSTLSRASHVNLEMVSQVGEVNLQSEDWQQIEVGDVILFDHTQAKLEPHGLSGKAVLKVSEEAQQGLLVELIDTQEKLTVKVLDFYGG